MVNTDDGYKMYDVEANVIEETFRPMVELTSQQVGIYEYIKLDEERGTYAYVFKIRVLVEEPFDEGDYMVLFDYLADFYEENEDEL